MCRILSKAIVDIWPEIKGDSLLGVGYSSCYVEPYLQQSSEVMVCMPAHQGAAYWPPSAANRVFLSHESMLPLANNSINRVLMVHSVENSEHLSWLIDEAWRVLTPGGRLLVVVPNRLGLWSHFSNNPFGTGRPFSKSQMKELLSDHDFTVTRAKTALFMPPCGYQTCCQLAEWFEKAGKWLHPVTGAVWLIEAEKQVYASIRQPVSARKGYHVPVRANKPAMGLKKVKKGT